MRSCEDLSCCLLTHGVKLKAISTLASVALDIKAAREQDQAYLDRSLAQLLRNDANIIQILEVQHNESLEAVRQLRNVCSILAAQLTIPLDTKFRSFQVKQTTAYGASCPE